MPARLYKRRTLIAAGLAASTGLLAGGCSTVLPPGRTNRAQPTLTLTPPALAPNRVIRDVVGLRPFRPQGFRVEAERLGDKLLIHNYGHGGCGITLCWGTGRMALEAALEHSGRRAAVLGAGAVGLAQARLLQDAGFSVTIYTKALPPDTTSNVAGGLWAPSGLVDREHRTAAFGVALAYASRFSHGYFQQLPTQRYGLRWLPVYLLSPRPEPGLGWDWGQTPELFRSVSHAPGSHPFGAAHVHEFRLPMIEPGTFLAATLDAFRIAGGMVVIRALRDPAELLTLPEDLIVNCTGLGARELAGDGSLVPVRGQLRVLAPQPALDYAVIELTTGLHLFPRPDGVLLGGTSEPGVWSLTPDPAVAERLLARHRRLFGVAGLEPGPRDGAA